MRSNLTERDVVVAGVRCPVLERCGDVPVVFLHGNPGAKEDWLFALDGLPPEFRGLALDLPAFGAADRPPGFDHSLDGYARHFGAALDQLGCDRVHLVLHDLGGLIGLWWARQCGVRLASLVLINCGVLTGWNWHLLARLWQTPALSWLAMKALNRPAFDALVGFRNPKRLPRAFLDRLYPTVDAGNLRAVRALYRSMRDADRLWADLAKGLDELDIAVLVLWGAADPFLPARHAEHQRQIFARAAVEVHVMEGCGHWPFLDDPEQTAGHIWRFVAKARR